MNENKNAFVNRKQSNDWNYQASENLSAKLSGSHGVKDLDAIEEEGPIEGALISVAPGAAQEPLLLVSLAVRS